MATSNLDDFENIEPGKARILLQPGIYPAQYVGKTLRRLNYGEKLYVEWNVFMDPAFQRHVTLLRFYNIKRNKARRLEIGDGHHYRKDWIAANNGRLPLDRGKLPFTVFEGRIMLVAVVTVKRDSQRVIHPSCFWSKIGWIVGPLEGHEESRGYPLEIDDC